MSGAMQERELPKPSEAAKARIGNFYLSGLLKSIGTEPLPQSYRHWHYMFEVNDIINEAVGVIIPEHLRDQLNFDSLHWQPLMWQPNTLPIVFCGYPEQIKQPKIQESIASVEIARRTDHSNRKEKFKPIYARVSGIINKRVLGMTYDTDSNQLVKVNASLSEEELTPGETDPDFRERLSIPILTSIDNPYLTAALITQAMVESTGRRDDEQPLPNHERAMVINLTGSDLYLGDANSFKDNTTLLKYLADLGMYIYTHNSKNQQKYLSFGLDQQSRGAVIPPEWNIKIPINLQEK